MGSHLYQVGPDFVVTKDGEPVMQVNLYEVIVYLRKYTSRVTTEMLTNPSRIPSLPRAQAVVLAAMLEGVVATLCEGLEAHFTK